MPRHKILAGLTAIVLAVVAATMIAGMMNPRPEPPEVRAEENLTPRGPLAAGSDPRPQPGGPRTGEEEDEELDAPRMTAVPLDGQDVADALRLAMWKFRFHLPENQYTGHVWAERWTRGADEPEVRPLGGGFHGVFEEDELVVQLPTLTSPQLLVRLGGATYRESDPAPVRPPDPWRVEVLAGEPKVQPGHDIHLVTFTHNRSGVAEGGLIGVHRSHDVTVYIKARFTPGPFVPFEEMRESGEGEELERAGESERDESSGEVDPRE